MKISLALAFHATASCLAAMTKGTIQVKVPIANKTLSLTTEFEKFDGRLIVSESTKEPVLQVQMDIEKGQTTEVDIEILNGFWIDIYPFLGSASNSGSDLTWYPPYTPYTKMLNVQQTPNATLVPKENALSACSPNGMAGLPPQASAIWKYDPAKGGLLSLTFLAPNGTRLPAQAHGSFYEGPLNWLVYGHGQPPQGSNEVIEFYFVPDSAKA